MKLKMYVVVFFMLCFLCENVFSQEKGVYTTLEQARMHPEEVITLQLKKKKLKEFPMEILSFTNLKNLDLSGNKLSKIPDQIGVLKQLEVLNLSKNTIWDLPESIGELVYLKVLDLNRNNLTSLPASIGNLVHLEKLILWSNNIDSLPEEISNLNDTLELLDMRSINMNPKKQQAIKDLLPKPLKEFDQPCNCSF